MKIKLINRLYELLLLFKYILIMKCFKSLCKHEKCSRFFIRPWWILVFAQKLSLRRQSVSIECRRLQHRKGLAIQLSRDGEMKETFLTSQ